MAPSFRRFAFETDFLATTTRKVTNEAPSERCVYRMISSRDQCTATILVSHVFDYFVSLEDVEKVGPENSSQKSGGDGGWGAGVILIFFLKDCSPLLGANHSNPK